MKVYSIKESIKCPGDYIITIEYNPFIICKKVRIEYIGSCTVFYKLPEFSRCSTSMEVYLCEELTKYKYETAKGEF